MPFLALSAALHAAMLIAISWISAPPLSFALRVPARMELGLVDGTEHDVASPIGSLAQEPSAAPHDAAQQGAVPPPPPEALAWITIPPAGPDEGVEQASVDEDAADPRPASQEMPAPERDEAPRAQPGEQPGEQGIARYAQGEGLGFSAEGFGRDRDAPRGGIIGLHVDLDRVRATSLIRETGPLLDIIPEWQTMLYGSGLNALRDFSRLFVATPNLARSHLVLSARARGGDAAVRAAARRLADAAQKRAEFEARNGLEMAPWRDGAATERAVALLPHGQLVLARRSDAERTLSVAAALAERNAREAGMEQLPGALSLLSMYEGEAVALTVEAAPEFIRSPDGAELPGVPRALRFSVSAIDGVHARLRAFGYYASSGRAIDAMDAVERLRAALLAHERVQHLGLRSALEAAELARTGATLELTLKLTLHQTRYLMAMARDLLTPARWSAGAVASAAARGGASTTSQTAIAIQ